MQTSSLVKILGDLFWFQESHNTQLLSDEEIRRIKLAALNANSVSFSAADKFGSAIFDLKTGQPVEATKGLEDRMCIQNIRSTYFDRIVRELEGIQDEVDEFACGESDSDQTDNVQEVKQLLHYIRYETTSEKEYPRLYGAKGGETGKFEHS